MGANRNFYVGPYLKCAVTYCEATIQVNGCPKCRRSFHGKFCGECGTAKGQFTDNIKTESVNFGDLYQEMIDKFGERFTYIPGDGLDGNQILIPNIRVEGIDRELWHHQGAEGIQPIEPTIIGQEIEAFKNTFKNEIDLFVKAYAPNTNIEWGLLHWYY